MLVAGLVAAPVLALGLTHAASVDVVTVADPAQGCQQFLDTTVIAAQQRLSIAASVPSLQALHDAATTTDSPLVGDHQPLLQAPSQTTFGAATAAVRSRCLTDRDLTRSQVNTWVTKLKSF